MVAHSAVSPLHFSSFLFGRVGFWTLRYHSLVCLFFVPKHTLVGSRFCYRPPTRNVIFPFRLKNGFFIFLFFLSFAGWSSMQICSIFPSIFPPPCHITLTLRLYNSTVSGHVIGIFNFSSSCLHAIRHPMCVTVFRFNSSGGEKCGLWYGIAVLELPLEKVPESQGWVRRRSSVDLCGASTGSDSAVEFSAFPKACRIMFLNFILLSCCIH